MLVVVDEWYSIYGFWLGLVMVCSVYQCGYWVEAVLGIVGNR